jgi:hypothetical protein
VWSYDSGGKYLGRDDVAGYGVAEGPSERIQVDEDDADDAAGWSTSFDVDVTFRHAGRAEADVEG